MGWQVCNIHKTKNLNGIAISSGLSRSHHFRVQFNWEIIRHFLLFIFVEASDISRSYVKIILHCTIIWNKKKCSFVTSLCTKTITSRVSSYNATAIKFVIFFFFFFVSLLLGSLRHSRQSRINSQKPFHCITLGLCVELFWNTPIVFPHFPLSPASNSSIIASLRNVFLESYRLS